LISGLFLAWPGPFCLAQGLANTIAGEVFFPRLVFIPWKFTWDTHCLVQRRGRCSCAGGIHEALPSILFGRFSFGVAASLALAILCQKAWIPIFCTGGRRRSTSIVARRQASTIPVVT